MGYSSFHWLATFVEHTYVPSLGTFAAVGGSAMVNSLLPLFIYISSFLFVISYAVYLWHKIIQVKSIYPRFENERFCTQRKLNKSERLKELLTEQVKPTTGISVVRGMDTVCNQYHHCICQTLFPNYTISNYIDCCSPSTLSRPQ